MRSSLIVAAVLFVFTANSQSFQGPALGQYPSGVYVSTNSFTSQPAAKAPKFETVRNKIRYKGEPWINKQEPNLPTELQIYNEGTLPTEAGGVVLMKDFEGITETNSIPPDPHVAVGPDHVLGTVNSDFAIWDKNGNLLKRINSATWYSAFGVDPFDPKVVYDHFAQRWVMVWLDQKDSPQSGSFLISVSDDSNPLGTWRNWVIPSSWNGNNFAGNWGDYQGVGYDEESLLITANQFSFAGYFDYAKIRVIKKSDLYYTPSDTCKWYDFWSISFPGSSGRVFNIRPVIHQSPSDTTYLVHIPYYSGSAYAIYRIIYGQDGVPVLNGSVLNVTAFQDPPQAAQPGGAVLESSGPELTNEPVFRDGNIWLAHSTRNPASTSYSAVRVCRFDPKTVQVLEQMTFGTANKWYFYPAVMSDKSGNIVFTASRSGLDEYISAYYVGKPSGSTSFTQPYLLKAGRGPYNKDYGSGRNRWGDYLGISIDPTGESFWMMSEYVANAHNWSNWIGEVRMMPLQGASLKTSTASLDFKTLERNRDKDTITVHLVNVGSQPLIVSAIGKSNPNFQLLGPASYPVTINSFDSVAVKVVCNPQVTGILRDTLVVDDNDGVATRLPVVVESYDLNPAQPQKIFTVTGATNSGNTYTINKSTGEATLLGASGSTAFVAIKAHPKSAVVYGIKTSVDGSEIWKMDANTGKLFIKMSIDVTEINAIAFDTAGTLHLLSKRSLLYKFDEATGTSTKLDSVKAATAAIAFDPFTNSLYGAIYKPLGSGKDQLYRINLATGDTTRVGLLGTGKPLRDIFFDESGSMFGFMGSPSEASSLVSINKGSGAGSVIGSTGLAGLVSSAYYPGVINSIGGEVPASIVGTYMLYDNYPNPFNPSTVIRYALPFAGNVELKVYNTLGEKVAELVNSFMPAGEHTIQFDATSLTSGVYFYELKSGDFRAMKKMVMVK